jgi:hypothetical protein
MTKLTSKNQLGIWLSSEGGEYVMHKELCNRIVETVVNGQQIIIEKTLAGSTEMLNYISEACGITSFSKPKDNISMIQEWYSDHIYTQASLIRDKSNAFKYFYINKDVRKLAERVKIDKFKPEMLVSFEHFKKPVCYLLDDVCYRFVRKGERIHVLRLKREWADGKGEVHARIKEAKSVVEKLHNEFSRIDDAIDKYAIEKELGFENLSKQLQASIMYDKLTDPIEYDKITRDMMKKCNGTDKDFRIDYTIFWMDVERGAISWDYADEVMQNHINEFIQFICFIELGDIEVNVVMPKKHIGKTRKTKLLNESEIPIKVVGPKWNTQTLVVGPIEVTGHFRLQPYGKGWSKVKLIWIDPYQKGSYTRKTEHNA